MFSYSKENTPLERRRRERINEAFETVTGHIQLKGVCAQYIKLLRRLLRSQKLSH